MAQRRKLYDKLQVAWNSAMAVIMATAPKKKVAATKGRKAKENPTARYLNITSVTRNQVLSAHIRDAKQKLKADVVLFLENRRKGVSDNPVPRFDCIPPQDQMVRLIDRSADHSDAPNSL